MAANLTPAQLELFQEENPDFCCSINLELMLDPVVAMDGHTYDRVYITQWLVNHDTSPKTNAPLGSKFLLPNHALKSAIEKSLENFRKRLDSEANVKGQDTTPNPSEEVALTPTVSESSNEAASTIPSDIPSFSSPSSLMVPPVTSSSSSSSSSRSIVTPVMPSSSSSSSSRSIVTPVMPSSSSSSSSRSIVTPAMSSSSSSSSSSASSPIARSPDEEEAIQECAYRLGIMQILKTSNIVDRQLGEKIQQECVSAIEHIERPFPGIKAQISPQEIEAARLDLLRKLNAIPDNILSLYNKVREKFFDLADASKDISRQDELRSIQKQLEEDWPEIRSRLLLDQAKGLPILSFAGAVSLSTVPRRPVIPAPYLVNGPDPVNEKANASLAAQEPSSFRASLHNLKCSFKSRFFDDAASQTSLPAKQVVKSFDPQYDYLFKVLLMGDSGVGKSSLILRYIDDIYAPNIRSDIGMGVDHKIKTLSLNELTVRLQIWDIWKTERHGFPQINFNHCRSINIVIVAFDVTNRESFEHVINHLKEIDRFARQDIMVTLVATKCDAPKAAWKVSEEEIRQLGISTGKDVFFTSAKAEEHGFVDQLFEGVTKSIIADKVKAAPSGPSGPSKR